ncbi:hypothetical protein A5721_26805 [Mycobacterium vulneris]|nr:hypothetical protein A5721_26805 [Mycolicibacterium vulneris]
MFGENSQFYSDDRAWQVGHTGGPGKLWMAETAGDGGRLETVFMCLAPAFVFPPPERVVYASQTVTAVSLD